MESNGDKKEEFLRNALTHTKKSTLINTYRVCVCVHQFKVLIEAGLRKCLGKTSPRPPERLLALARIGRSLSRCRSGAGKAAAPGTIVGVASWLEVAAARGSTSFVATRLGRAVVAFIVAEESSSSLTFSWRVTASVLVVSSRLLVASEMRDQLESCC